MLRSAFKTFEGFIEMHSELSDKARECSSLHLAYTEIKPPGWDAPAFCTNLAEAVKFKGLRHSSTCKIALSRAVCDWKANARKASLQKVFHTCVSHSIACKVSWVPFINGKLIVLGASSGPGDFDLSPQVWHEFCLVVRKSPSSSQTCFLKTVINSWYTTHRMGEVPLLPCIFGCEHMEDNLKHYLRCEPLWTLAVSACGLPLSFLSLSPLDRLCIVSKSPTGLKLLSVVFRGYHALKLGHRSLIDSCVASKVFDEVLLMLLKLCRELWRFH
jgi:hypothetical protein